MEFRNLRTHAITALSLLSFRIIIPVRYTFREPTSRLRPILQTSILGGMSDNDDFDDAAALLEAERAKKAAHERVRAVKAAREAEEARAKASSAR